MAVPTVIARLGSLVDNGIHFRSQLDCPVPAFSRRIFGPFDDLGQLRRRSEPLLADFRYCQDRASMIAANSPQLQTVHRRQTTAAARLYPQARTQRHDYSISAFPDHVSSPLLGSIIREAAPPLRLLQGWESKRSNSSQNH